MLESTSRFLMSIDQNGRAHRGRGVGGGQFSPRQKSAPEIVLSDGLVSISTAAKEVGLSVGWLRQLTDQGRVSFQTTSGGHRRFSVESLKRELEGEPEPEVITRSLQGLNEEDVWKEVLGKASDIPPMARSILYHGVTEMVNNAIDHSSGSHTQVSYQDNGQDIIVTVSDNGVGAFRHLSEHFGLPGAEHALIEVTKGKRTSAPDKHAGEGLFFTLRMMDEARVEANGLAVWAQTDENSDTEFAQGTSRVKEGTVVTLRIAKDTTRRIADVFARFAPMDDETGTGTFAETSVPLHLVRVTGGFVARSEAKRLASGLEKHARAEIDFSQHEVVGQGFADELFRVWAKQNPQTVLSVRGANPVVRMMIQRTGFTGDFV